MSAVFENVFDVFSDFKTEFLRFLNGHVKKSFAKLMSAIFRNEFTTWLNDLNYKC